MERQTKILVVGSGVIGMTTALSLSKFGCKLTVLAKDKPGQTTSATAAALWLPFQAEPKDKVAIWGEKSLAVFKEMESIPETGVAWHELAELFLPDSDWPWWQNSIEGFRADDKIIDLPAGKRKVCYYKIPIIDTSKYLDYLEKTLLDCGTEFKLMQLSSIGEAFEFANVVINCSGIGAIDLVNDTELHPARGQIIHIKRKPHHKPLVDLSLFPRFAHITPRSHDTVIGGTFEDGVFNLEPNKDEVQAIIERCRAISPDLGELESADIIDTVCGLRPIRSSVRVEVDKSVNGKRRLFHNYGHGGAGFTLSWGCAEEISDLVEAALVGIPA